MKPKDLGFATTVVRGLAVQLPTADEVQRFGRVADDGCALFHGAVVASTVFEFGGRGLEVPKVATGVAPRVFLDPDDADDAFRELTPRVRQAGVLAPFLAGVMGEFDSGGSRLRVLRVTHLLFQTEAALRRYRPGSLPRSIRRRMENGFVRIGNVQWYEDDDHYDRPERVSVTDEMIGDIFDRRTQLVEAWEKAGQPRVAFAGVN